MAKVIGPRGGSDFTLPAETLAANTLTGSTTNKLVDVDLADPRLPDQTEDATLPFTTTNRFGVVGDGLTDDTAAIQTMLTDFQTNADGAKLTFPPGRIYRVSSTMSYVVSASGHRADVVIDLNGSVIEWHGVNDDIMFDISADGSAGLKPRVQFVGGVIRDGNASTGVTAIKFRDLTAWVENMRIQGNTGWRGIMLENWSFWCEQSQLFRTSIGACRHALYFSGATDSGGPGSSASFARTRVIACNFASGEAGFGLIRVSGNPYHSLFIGLTGNVNPGVYMFQCDGAVSFVGSVVLHGGVEGGDPGWEWFHESAPGNITVWPQIIELDSIGTGGVLTNSANGVQDATTRITGKAVLMSGDEGSETHLNTASTLWQLALRSELEVTSDRAGGGTRVNWMNLDSGNDLVLGGAVATRSPSAIAIGPHCPLELRSVNGNGFINFREQTTAPAAPAANEARLFAQDDGGGKTQLVVQFPTGTPIVLATEV